MKCTFKGTVLSLGAIVILQMYELHLIHISYITQDSFEASSLTGVQVDETTIDEEKTTNGDNYIVSNSIKMPSLSVQIEEEKRNIEEEITNTEDNKTNEASEPSVKHSFDGISACLLIKNDNSRLIEWLAYHYHTLPLRHIIVAVDPSSKITPLPVLQRWDDSELEYIIWDDKDYIAAPDMKKMEYEMKKALKAGPEMNEVLIKLHRKRQKVFLSQCYKHHNLLNHSWVVHVDTDEYVVFNTISDDESPSTNLDRPLTPNRERITLPKIGQKTMLEVINENQRSPCIAMTRVLFSAVDAPDLEMEAFSHYPPSLDRKNFDTLRYLRHHIKGDPNFTKKDRNPNGEGKMLVNVSRLPVSDLKIFSIHRPFKVCPCCWKGPKAYADSIFRINHYLGSWEAYNSRSDVRRDRDTFNKKAYANDGPSFDICPWLGSFIKEVGEQKAQNFLQNAGEIEMN